MSETPFLSLVKEKKFIYFFARNEILMDSGNDVSLINVPFHGYVFHVSYNNEVITKSTVL